MFLLFQSFVCLKKLRHEKFIVPMKILLRKEKKKNAQNDKHCQNSSEQNPACKKKKEKEKSEEPDPNKNHCGLNSSVFELWC